MQDWEGAGVQGAAGPLAEREVSSLPPISLPPQAAKRDFAPALAFMAARIECEEEDGNKRKREKTSPPS